MLVKSKHLDKPLIIKFWYEPNFFVVQGNRVLGFMDTPPAPEAKGSQYDIFAVTKTGCAIKLGARDDQTIIAEAYSQQAMCDLFVKDLGRRLALKRALRVFCEKNTVNIENHKKRGLVNNEVIGEVMAVYNAEHRTPNPRGPKH